MILKGTAQGQARRISRVLREGGFPRRVIYRGVRGGYRNPTEVAGFAVSVIGTGRMVSVRWCAVDPYTELGKIERRVKEAEMLRFLAGKGIELDARLWIECGKASYKKVGDQISAYTAHRVGAPNALCVGKIQKVEKRVSTVTGYSSVWYHVAWKYPSGETFTGTICSDSL